MMKFYIDSTEVTMKLFINSVEMTVLDDIPVYNSQLASYDLNEAITDLRLSYTKEVSATLILYYAQEAVNGNVSEFTVSDYGSDYVYEIEFMFDCNGLEQLEELRKVLGR